MGLLQRSEKTRLFTMLSALVLMGALIFKLRPTRVTEAPPAAGTTAPAGPRAILEKLSQGEIPVDAPGTDLDAAEWVEARRAFAAVLDNTYSVEKDDNWAYWRLMQWSEKLDETVPLKRAKPLAYHQVISDPAAYRGDLTKFDLNVRRVYKYEAVKNVLGVEKTYELMGTTDEYGVNYPYSCTVAHIPPGMPVGDQVQFRVTFYGYFFKSMGYALAGDKPGPTRYRAPMLIGRIIYPCPTDLVPRTDESPMVWIGGGLILLGIVAFAVWRMWIGPTKRRPLGVPASSATVGAWLESQQKPESTTGGSGHPADPNRTIGPHELN